MFSHLNLDTFLIVLNMAKEKKKSLLGAKTMDISY